MTSAYSILAPQPVDVRAWHRRRQKSRASWITAMACLIIGVPLALGSSLYLLAADQSDRQAELELPDLPSEDATDLAGIAPAAGPYMDSPGILRAEEAAELAVPAEDPSRRIIRLAWGDTLAGLLMKAAVPEAEAHGAMQALRKVYDPRDIQAGEEVVLRFDPSGLFTGFEFEPSSERTVRVERNGQEYKAASIVRPLSRNVMAAHVVVDDSLYESGTAAGIPASVMSSLVKALSFSVDFQRDIRAGSSFRVMYEVVRNPEGELVRAGELLFAEVKLGDRTVPVYRYRKADGSTELYDRQGKSVRKAIMRTPVNASRISSGFGMRRHPVLGYSKMHEGVDFAAPTGTPIYAAGDGVVVERGWKGGYGNYVRIRHNRTLETAYAHMSRYASSVTRGTRVKQGQVIGYVGSTGRSTGPHLHFEVLVSGQQVNPMKVANLDMNEGLKGQQLERFRGLIKTIDTQFEQLPQGLAQDVAFAPPSGAKVNPVVAD